MISSVYKHHWPPVYPVITLNPVIILCQIGVSNFATATVAKYIWMRSQAAVDVPVQISMIADYIALLVLLQKQTIQYCSQHIDFCCCCCIKPLGSVNTKLKHNNVWNQRKDSSVLLQVAVNVFSLWARRYYCVNILSMLTISAKLFSYCACVAHIQNNALLYFCDIIQCMHITACVC